MGCWSFGSSGGWVGVVMDFLSLLASVYVSVCVMFVLVVMPLSLIHI